MLEAMKNLRRGKINDIKNDKLFPLMTWNSGAWQNIPICSKVNKLFFRVKPRILLGMLSLGIDKNQTWIRYPKAKKDKDDKLNMLKPYIKKVYKWSEQEWDSNLTLIVNLISDKQFLDELNKIVGFSKRESKKLNLEYTKYKVEKLKESNSASIFDFGG